MAELTVCSPAKINLHLEVLGLRPDGFHELAMVMQTIELLDLLCFAPTADGQIQLSCDRPELPTDASNLVVQAAELLKARAGLPELGARITLHKRIPVGAGLAGGSSNGAATLVGLNTLWGLGFSATELQAMASRLGSDVPFCLAGGTQLCFGRGERLEPVPAPALPPLAVLLLKHPDASVSTPWAYGRYRDQCGSSYLQGEAAFEQRRQALRRAPLVQNPLRNDLQTVVEPEVASVASGLALLRSLGSRPGDGPLAVAMSGSGPSVFALFASLEEALAGQAQLAEAIDQAGIQSWACLCRDCGVTLEP